MEHLTELRDGQNVIPLRQNFGIPWALCSAGLGDESTHFLYGAAADTLAAYQKTGLDPDTCSEYKKFEDELVRSGKSFAHVLDLLKAEEDGRMLVLNEKPMPTVMVETNTDAYCPYCGESVSGYWGCDASVPDICQCPECGGYINVVAAPISRSEAEIILEDGV